MRFTFSGRALAAALSLSFALGLAGPAGATADMSRKGASIAYAKLSDATGTVMAFGGKGTTQAVASGGGGYWSVTFTGKFPADVTAERLILQSSCESGNYGVANSYVASATPTEIEVVVFCWKSNTLSYDADDGFVNVFFGRLP